MHIKGRVENGRIKVEEHEPIDLPEGTGVTLYLVDVDDDMDDAERAELEKALTESQEDIKAGRLVDAEDVLKGLRSR